MAIGTSALAQYDIDGAVGMYSGIFNNPFFIWGRYRRLWFKTRLTVSFQFHHTQMDGAHAARFSTYCKRDNTGILKNPDGGLQGYSCGVSIRSRSTTSPVTSRSLAYKSAEEIIATIVDTVTIDRIIRQSLISKHNDFDLISQMHYISLSLAMQNYDTTPKRWLRGYFLLKSH